MIETCRRRKKHTEKIGSDRSQAARKGGGEGFAASSHVRTRACYSAFDCEPQRRAYGDRYSIVLYWYTFDCLRFHTFSHVWRTFNRRSDGFCCYFELCFLLVLAAFFSSFVCFFVFDSASLKLALAFAHHQIKYQQLT